MRALELLKQAGQAGLSGLQQAGGLGLSGLKMVGETAAEGLGLAPKPPPGMFGAPGEYKPADFSDLNPLQNVLLRFQNAVASGEGQPLVSTQQRAQRAAGNEQRLKAFGEGVKLLTDFDAIRDKAGPDDYDRINGLLKKRFAELAGGQPGEADEFYDTFMSGGAGNTAGLLKLIANDAGAQQLLQAGGGMGELRQYVAQKTKDGIVLGDQEALPRVRQQLDALLRNESVSPEERASIDKLRGPDGNLTLEGLRQVFGPRMSASDWAVLDRHQLDLADMGVTASKELLERRKAGYTTALKQEEDAARIKAELEADITKLEKEAELGKFKGRNAGPGGTTAQQRVFSDRVLAQRTKYREGVSRLNQFLKTPYNGPGSYQILNGWISSLDNTAAREGEVQVVREEAASMADRLRLRLRQFTEGAVIPETTFNEIKALMMDSKERIQELERKYVGDQVHISRTLFPDDQDPEGAANALIPGWRETLAGEEPAAAPAAAPGGEAPPVEGAVKRKRKDGTEVWVVPVPGGWKPVQ